ncbi:hypothetical protein P243_1469 [Klebsiella pneumoniae subsp. pneumoniae 1158]|nr:hypothetical protein P243_1469 [Klebsiella pneumoniae subsp. pneumoniae 1158]
MFFEKYNKDSILDNNLSYSDDENSFLSQKVNPIFSQSTFSISSKNLGTK